MFSDKSDGNEHIVMKRFGLKNGFSEIENQITFKKIIHSFEAVKPLGRVEIVPSPYVTESTRVALLLPTFEHQTKETLDFMAHYEKTCMEHQDNTFLMLVKMTF